MAAKIYLNVYNDIIMNNRNNSYKISLNSVPPVGDVMYQLDKDSAKFGLFIYCLYSMTELRVI